MMKSLFILQTDLGISLYVLLIWSNHHLISRNATNTMQCSAVQRHHHSMPIIQAVLYMVSSIIPSALQMDTVLIGDNNDINDRRPAYYTKLLLFLVRAQLTETGH